MSLDAFIAAHWGTMLTALFYLVSAIGAYQKGKSELESVKTSMADLRKDFKELKDGGAPLLCRLHEERLRSVETTLAAKLELIVADISELKRYAADNRELIQKAFPHHE